MNSVSPVSTATPGPLERLRPNRSPVNRLCPVPVIGVIGGIGSGKSSVARWAAERLPVLLLDADQLGHRALKDPEIRAQLVAEFGPQIVDAAGEIDRRLLALRVFGDRAEEVQARQRLEAIVHPQLRAEMEQQLRSLDPGLTQAVLLDAALLQEAGWDEVCDAVVFIEIPGAERARRVFNQRGWSAEELTTREASQWPVERKRSLATHRVWNTGSLAVAGAALGELVRELLTESTHQST